MSALSRRSFLRSGSLTVAAAGVMTAVPGFSTLLATSGVDAPAVDTATATALDNPALDSSLVAHVRDLSTGEIAVYHGTDEYVFHDPQMAARIFQASR